MPFFLKLTTSFAVFPRWIRGVFFPLILKSCGTWPMFLKEKVILPGFAADLTESRRKNSPLTARAAGSRPDQGVRECSAVTPDAVSDERERENYTAHSMMFRSEATNRCCAGRLSEVGRRAHDHTL